MVRLRRRRDHGLHAVEQVPTLRDRLVGLPVEPAIPDHWELGCKVVKFKDELPADAITLQRPRRAQELILTTAGTDDRKTLGIYEHDRTRGRRTRLSTVEHEETRALKATLYEAFTDTCRHAARIDGLPPSVAAIDARDPSVVVENERVHDEGDDGVVERVLTKISFY